MKKTFYFLFVFCLPALFFVTVLSSIAQAQIIRYVNLNGAGNKDGTSWANAYGINHFQQAIDEDGVTQVWVERGFYIDEYSGWLGYHMKNGVAIYGGFDGTETAISQRHNFGFGEVNETILDGNDNPHALEYCLHIFFHPEGTNLTSSAVLDGFRIQNGHGQNTNNQYPWSMYGGGMFNYNSSPTLANITFFNNSAVTNGGGMCNIANSNPTLINVTFKNDSAYTGGGMYNSTSSPTLTNVTFKNNSSGYEGGGIFNTNSSPTLTNVIIRNNSGSFIGGGMDNYDNSKPTLTNVTVSNNSATYGGGISNSSSSSSTLNNCIVWGNTATSGNQFIINGGVTTLHYSCYVNGTNDVVTSNGGTFTVTDHDIINDPKFIDTANGDLRIYGVSPCVNTGNNTYNTESKDIRGQDRIQNTTIDMGAYEWTSGIDPNPVIVYVKYNAAGLNNGTSWINAYTSFQSALDGAISGKQIWVAKGTYTPANVVGGTGTRFKTFRMINGVAIYGGFAGTETAINQRTNFAVGGTNETIFSGDIGTIGNNTDNCYHVFYHPDGTGLTSSSVLDGFTITNGNADGTGESNYGGGMYNNNSSPVITNVTFKNNSANSGGGLYNSGSSPAITNVTFKNNSANTDGGGIYNYNNSSTTLTNVTFSSNSANQGGGICNNSSSPNLTNVTINGNSAGNQGGGVSNYNNSSPILNNCIVWGNTAVNNGKQFYINGGITTLHYSCYANGTNDVYGGVTATDHDIIANPNFVDAYIGDLRIYGASPCVNTGNNAYNTESKDIRGQDRIQNTTIDMGAYEWTNGIDPNVVIVYVKYDAAGLNTGTSWTNAYSSFQSALDGAISGNQIWVAKGIYYPTVEVGGSGTRYKTFQMKNGVAIYGGFDGTETAISQRTNFGDGKANETFLSGDIGTIGNNTDNCYHVFYHPDETGLTSSSVLDGFTITNGNADGTGENNYGGGMFNYNSSPTLANITFFNNSAVANGGGMCNSGSSPAITNVIFKNNSANSGGGLYNSGSSPAITNVTFKNNSANTDGGGIYNFNNSSTTLTNVTFSSNSANQGGGICNNSSSPNLTNVTINGNSAGNQGGGVSNYNNSSPILNNCIVWGNTAVSNGKQFYINGGITTLHYSCYANGTNDVYGGVTATDHDIIANPNFVDAVNGDLRIFGTSPCVNTGNNAYNTESKDIRGQVRIQNTTIDMGAYEWTNGIDPYALIVYVKHDAAGLNNGTNWTNAYTSFQSALDVALSGNIIWVSKGTYKPSSAYGLGGGSRMYHFEMKYNVAIYGGFEGTETAISQRCNFGVGGANETILSGDIGTIGNNTDNCYHVFYHSYEIGLNSSSILDGFTITGGNANGEEGTIPSYGGGMFNDRNSPALTNVSFTNNSASTVGGAIYNSSSNFTLTNVTISNNSADQGGGMFDESSSPTLTNVTICNNSANYGGGIYNEGSTEILNNCIVWGNTAPIVGNQFAIYGGVTSLHYSCYANGTNDVYGGVTASDHNIIADPKFVDAVNGDFRINGFSLCENSGFNGYNIVSQDIRGQARIQNTTIDMGAYEWTSGIDPVLQIVYVKHDAAGLNNGTSWANAYTSFQSALDGAVSNKPIWVAKGTYYPTIEAGGTGPRFKTFQMKNGVTIYGGFAGTETAINQRTNFGVGEANETICSGDLGTIGNKTDNCYHVFYHPNGTGLTGSSVLDGFTITCGNADGTGENGYGGGIYNYNNSPTLTNIAFSYNSTGSFGGGMYNYNNSSPALTNILFSNNSAVYNGGGVYNYNSSPAFKDVTISNNSADYGSGIYNDNNSSPALTNVIIINNSAGSKGGGMLNYSSNPVLNNVTISNNSAGYGGGVYNYNSSPSLNNCIVWGNNAATDGKQFYIAGGITTLHYSCYAAASGNVYIYSGISGGAFTATDNNITADPQFVGAGKTIYPYSLPVVSPCVDAGNDSYNSEVYDIRGAGFPRKLNKGTIGLAGTIDMGAYEYNPDENPMPVELTSFTAASTGSTNSASVELKWGTATEVNNYGFEVQRSIKDKKSKLGYMWNKVGFVNGNGNSNSPKDYIFIDNELIESLPVGQSISGGVSLQYRLKQIDNNGAFKYSKEIEFEFIPIPKVFCLYQNYPNPFNPTTTIKYDLPQQSKVVLKVYDMLGKEMFTLLNEEKQAGSYIVQLSTVSSHLASGVYIYRLQAIYTGSQAGNFTSVKKLVLLK